VVGQFPENEPEAAEVVDGGKLIADFVFAEKRLVVEHVEFEGGDAAETPAGDGEGANELLFENADGLIVCLVGIEEGFEVFLGFTFEGVELRGEAVLEGVAGGAGFAFGSGGSL
jgi:hypothetical protein